MPEAPTPGDGATADRPARTPDHPAIPNFRDVGGHATRDGGRIRTGQLYRSVELSRIGDGGAAELAALGIRVVYDLRTDGERDMAPDRLPPGARIVVVDVLADDVASSPAAIGPIFEDPAAAERALGGGRSERFFLDRYPAFVSAPAARAAYARLYSALATPDGRPAIVHCTTGKDRTGWAVAALLLLLDVPEEHVMRDYLASGPALAPVVEPLLAEFRSRGGDPALLEPFLSVRPEYLAAGLDEVARAYGSVPAYFAVGLGIDEAGQEALREALVERP
jgi:protein-tyrosine phosphatase